MQCRWRVGLLAVLCFVFSSALSQDATLDRARGLIQANQGRAAFDLLAPLEQQRAGDVEYDYLLGLAAIDAAQYTRAVFALERVLAVRPNHPQARAEIARAYFLMARTRRPARNSSPSGARVRRKRLRSRSTSSSTPSMRASARAAAA